MASPGVFIVWSMLLWFCLTVGCITCDGHFENVARNKSCTISSMYDPNHPASAAVNGDTGGLYESNNNCIHTKNEDYSWWEVNLGGPFPVYNITVWARDGFFGRLEKCNITVDGRHCNQIVDVQSRDINISCTSGVINGRVVRLERDFTKTTLDAKNIAINMCEFQVWSCSARYWGSGCDQVCGECRDGAPCDKVTGHCDSGCKNRGLEPPLCTQGCSNGTFGQDCKENCSGNCADVCNNVTGHCTCKPGWKFPNCVNNCDGERYGYNCSEVCGACGGVTCHHVNGSCQNCSGNFRLPYCRPADCVDGYFGQTCNESCQVKCANTCDERIGNCTCTAEWRSSDCDTTTAPTNSQFSESSQTAGVPVPIIAGAAAGGGAMLLLVIAIIVVVVVRRRRTLGRKPNDRRRMTHQSTEDLTHHANVYENVPDAQIAEIRHASKKEEMQMAASGKDEGQRDFVKTGGEERNSWAKGDDKQPKPTAIVKPNMAPKPKPKIGTPAGAVYSNVDASRGQQPSVSSAHGEVLPTSQPDVTDDADVMDPAEEAKLAVTAYYNDVEYMTSQEVTLGLDRVQQYLLGKLRGHSLNGEFEQLPVGHRKDAKIGLTDENRPKNRFKCSILPYDENRVLLRGGDDNDSYINASYIKGVTSDTVYIAAQGPKSNTVTDFWKMIWQEKTTHIVMLTNLMEGEKNKCAEYWPPKGARRQHGSVNVTGLDVAQRADYIIRTFDVRGEGGSSTRHVTQYHFVTWPDHHVPTATALVDFWRTVVTSHHNQRSPAPLLVHCSAGVGRTGTFIALDIAMNGAQNQSEIDIFHIVQRMREDRINMVQTKSQYRFLHEAILEAYTSRHTRLALLSFNSFFPDDIQPRVTSSYIDKEFKMLSQMKVLLHKPSHTVAEHEDNVGKNRTLDVLPDDSQIIYLTTHVRGRNQYINAVSMPTFFARQGCIVTHLPLPHTLVDIWRLVDGNDVTAVVSLGAEVDGTEERCCYWPRQEGQSLTFGSFVVTLTAKTTLGDCLTIYTMSLRSGDSSAGREVRLLQYTGWTGDVADNTADLLQLVDLVNSQPGEGEEGRAPVVVQCLDGASKSGLFRVICDVINRMMYDHDVDVYMAVRHVQTVRPECVTSLEQYRYVYHIVQTYQRGNAVYSN